MSEALPAHLAARQFLEYLENDRNYSPKTIEAYHADLFGPESSGRGNAAPGFCQHLVRALGVDAPMLSDVTQREVRGYLAELHRRGMARRSVARKLAAVKSFMKFLMARGLIEANPARLVQTPKLEKRLPTVLSTDEARDLMELPDRTTAEGWRDTAILELLYSTGIRRAEICGAEIRDLDLRSRMLKVMGKGGKERIVPFGDHACDALGQYMARRDEQKEVAKFTLQL
ncbi:MAG: tyrosine-type recombinase/integrase, partial [Bacteroidota bacterium]